MMGGGSWGAALADKLPGEAVPAAVVREVVADGGGDRFEAGVGGRV